MKIRNFFYLTLLLSILLHLGSFLAIHFSSKPQDMTIDMSAIEFQVLDNYKNMQIVEQNNKPLNDDIDEKTKYLGQFNQKVIKETKAKESGKFNNEAGQGSPIVGSTEKSKVKKSIQKLEKTSGDMAVTEKFSPKMNWADLARKNENLGVERPGQVSQTSDYLKETEIGPETMLSTREFVYYTYFNRIKGQIQQVWEPKIKDKIRALFLQGRTIASNQDKRTKLLIVLNSGGQLEKIQILGESGIEDLDDAAIEAFKAAAPFPNPPAGIVEKDGKIKIQWDFVLEV